MYDHTEVGSRGYLTEEFRLFHLRDQKQLQLDYHYHPFDKIVIPLSGQVTYLVEGCTYYLRPWDILLVGRGEIHRPAVDLSEPYERMVLWLRPRLEDGNQELLDCFQRIRAGGPRLLRPEPEARPGYMSLLHDLEQAQHSRDFGHQVLARTYFLQLLVNILWPLFFFRLQWRLFAFFWLLLLLALLSLTMAGFRYIRKSSYWLLVPYFLWVLFAGYLNLGNYLLNM